MTVEHVLCSWSGFSVLKATSALFYKGYLCDALVTLGGCDKSVPGALMPLARCNAVRRLSCSAHDAYN